MAKDRLFDVETFRRRFVGWKWAAIDPNVATAYTEILDFIDKAVLRGIKEFAEKHASHDRDCILSWFEAGEPAPDGVYRQKFKGKWYQARPVDETPKCDCGLDAELARLEAEQKLKEVGK